MNGEADRPRVMNALGELLAVDRISLDVDVVDGPQLLQAMATLLSHGQAIPVERIAAQLDAREHLGSTGMGHGVALPHARMTQCGTAQAAFVRTSHPIPFDAPDHKPASLFIGLLIPNRAEESHLQLLATAAGVFSERSLREQLMACRRPDEVRALIGGWAG